MFISKLEYTAYSDYMNVAMDFLLFLLCFVVTPTVPPKLIALSICIYEFIFLYRENIWRGTRSEVHILFQ